jgi:hypothetical protein
MWEYFVAVLAIVLAGCGGSGSAGSMDAISASSGTDIGNALDKGGSVALTTNRFRRVIVSGVQRVPSMSVGVHKITHPGWADVGFAVLDRLKAEMLHRVGLPELRTTATQDKGLSA